MKKQLLLFIFALAVFTVNAQDAGIFQSYAIIDTGGSNTYYASALNPDGAPDSFDGQNFGTPATLVLNGGQIKTFKNNGGDVTGGEINYRVYEQGTTPPAFTAIAFGFGADLGGGDQIWETTNANVDLYNGISTDGTYVIEVYWRAFTNLGDRFDSNGGTNYTATFVYDTATLSLNSSTNFETKLYASNKTLNIKSNQNINSLEIYSILGTQVFNKKGLNAKDLSENLSQLSSGIYIAKIATKNGSISKKFML